MLRSTIPKFAGVVAWVESLQGRMGGSARQVDGLFESLLVKSFDGGRRQWNYGLWSTVNGLVLQVWWRTMVYNLSS